jgi:excisionase family DNA binding protein
VPASQLTLAEAAETLGVSISEIQHLITLGRLEFQQVCSGRCELLVSRDSVLALLPAS